MAQYFHVRCVVRIDRTNAHERIHSVGGVKPDGSRWKLTQEKAISYIQDGTCIALNEAFAEPVYRSLRTFKDFSAASSAICSS